MRRAAYGLRHTVCLPRHTAVFLSLAVGSSVFAANGKPYAVYGEPISPAKWYRVDFPQGAEKPLVTALMLESSMPRLTPQEWAEQKRWIAEQLTNSPARWPLACAHHPLFSNGSNGDNGVLQQEWGPIFKACGLDFYVGGHDHDLQHLEIPNWPFTFVQAGGGGQSITDMRRDLRGPFSRKVYGFVHLHLEGDKADVRYVAAPDARNHDVRVIHHFAREKETGKVTVVSTTGIDRATTTPLMFISS